MTKTVKEIVDAYNNNPLVKSIIDSEGCNSGYHNVVIVADSTEQKAGIQFKFEDVAYVKKLSNYQFISEQKWGLVHSTMFCGHITDLYTEIDGKLISTTTKLGTREYKEDD
jgi:hypothetical protein